MSANAFEEDKKLAFAAGMSGYIVKPLDVQILLRELRQLTEEGALKTELREQEAPNCQKGE